MKWVRNEMFDDEMWLLEEHPVDVDLYGKGNSWRYGVTEKFLFCGGQPVDMVPKWFVIA